MFLVFSDLIEIWEMLEMAGSKKLLLDRAPTANCCGPPVAQNYCLAAVVVTIPLWIPKEYWPAIFVLLSLPTLAKALLFFFDFYFECDYSTLFMKP